MGGTVGTAGVVRAGNEVARRAEDDDTIGAVQRALDTFPPDLVSRVRARIRAHEAADVSLGRHHFRHVDADFDSADVTRVLELLVDLGELQPTGYNGVYRARRWR